MQSVECKSSNLAWRRYDATTRVLEVDFKGKDGSKQSTYAYDDFPEELWLQWNAATSPGQFFAQHVRFAKNPDGTPRFRGRKIWPA